MKPQFQITIVAIVEGPEGTQKRGTPEGDGLAWGPGEGAEQTVVVDRTLTFRLLPDGTGAHSLDPFAPAEALGFTILRTTATIKEVP